MVSIAKNFKERMKKFFIPLLTGAIVASIVLAGCAKAPAPAPVGIPAEPAGFPQPNPYWGLGFKADGSPYKFAYVSADLGLDFWMVANKTCTTQLKMSGAEVTSYDASWNLERQVGAIEDLIEEGVDGIVLYAIDTAGTGPVVDKAGQAGIPVFNVDIPTDSDYVTCLATYNQYEMGALTGEIMIDIAKRMDEHLTVLEVLCPMSFEVCVLRSEGFNDTVKDSSLVSVKMAVPGEARDELIMNAILDALPAHSDINAIYQDGGGPDGVIHALKQLGCYQPIGHADHVVWVFQSEGSLVCQTLRDKHMDGCATNSCWAMGDIAAKAALTYVCLGKSVPKVVELPVGAVTPDNLDISPYGGPMRWGDMLRSEPDVSKWPILDVEKYGMPTPHFTGR